LRNKTKGIEEEDLVMRIRPFKLKERIKLSDQREIK